jgi:hypothetical protein
VILTVHLLVVIKTNYAVLLDNGSSPSFLTIFPRTGTKLRLLHKYPISYLQRNGVLYSITYALVTQLFQSVIFYFKQARDMLVVQCEAHEVNDLQFYHIN